MPKEKVPCYVGFTPEAHSLCDAPDVDGPPATGVSREASLKDPQRSPSGPSPNPYISEQLQFPTAETGPKLK